MATEIIHKLKRRIFWQKVIICILSAIICLFGARNALQWQSGNSSQAESIQAIISQTSSSIAAVGTVPPKKEQDEQYPTPEGE